jgi:hypothetical protein
MELTKTVYKTRDEIIEELKHKAYDKGFLTAAEFSFLMENLLISEGEYVLDVGNSYQVWAEIALRIIKKIEKHPKLWKWLFMVA